MRDKNTSARLSIKNAGGGGYLRDSMVVICNMQKESGYLQKLEITHAAAVIELIWKQEQVFKLCCLG